MKINTVGCFSNYILVFFLITLSTVTEVYAIPCFIVDNDVVVFRSHKRISSDYLVDIDRAVESCNSTYIGSPVYDSNRPELCNRWSFLIYTTNTCLGDEYRWNYKYSALFNQYYDDNWCYHYSRYTQTHCIESDVKLYKIKITVDDENISDGRSNNDQLIQIRPTYPTSVSSKSQKLLPYKISLKAQVFDSENQIIPNVNVKIKSSVANGTGGHDHIDERRNTDFSGMIVVGDLESNEVVGSTGVDGFKFEFKSTRISGSHQITGSCEECLEEYNKNIEVGYFDFVELPDSEEYGKVGQVIGRHEDNHYGTTRLVSSLMLLSTIYNSMTSDNTPVLKFNDMSLIKGGLFDIYANWNSPHRTHRTGWNVDVRANNLEDAIPESYWYLFESLVSSMGGKARLENSGTPEQHYHLTFYPIK